MPDQEPEALLRAVSEINDHARAYFENADVALSGAERPHWAHSDSEHFLRQLPSELRTEASGLITAIQGIGSRLAPITARSVFLVEADQRDAGHAIKQMRAALRLRSYKHWDLEVLHDEGTVLGVRRAGQSEDEPLAPGEARTAYFLAAERLEGIIALASTTIGDVPHTVVSRPVIGTRPGTAFIMMWMNPENPELEDVAETVKRCFRAFGIEAVRADDIEHEDVITKRILDEIRDAEFLFADLTGERPSVYYEVGHAHAIGRRVMLFRKRNTPIHFDLAAYNCPEYDNLTDLEQQLNRRLESVTGERRQNAVSGAREE